MSETVLQLVVTIKYNPHGASVEDLKGNLEQAVHHAMGNGIFTGGGAEVVEHDVQIEDITPEPEPEPEPPPEPDPDLEERRSRFMLINARAHDIAKWLNPRTPGVNFMGSPKSWLAETYASRQNHGRKGGPTITDEMVDELIALFGQREPKRK